MDDKEYYFEYLKKTDKFPQSIYHAAKHDIISEVLERIPLGSSVLDAGCGIGNMTGKYCDRTLLVFKPFLKPLRFDLVK